MNFGLDEQTIKKIHGVFRSFPEIIEVVIYGSRAKGNYKPGSDIDLVIRNSSIDFHTLIRINAALEALHTPYTFDLSIFEDLQELALVDHIKRVGKIFYPGVA